MHMGCSRGVQKVNRSNHNRPTMIGYPIVIGSDWMEKFNIQLDRFGAWMAVQNRQKLIQFTI